jgi:hypothetical protein
MADQKNGKGFSGFDDLVSDISQDIEQVSTASATQSTANQPVNQSPSQASADHPIPSETQENEEFIALLKSVVNENKLDTIPNEDLLAIYNRARSIDASSKKLDIEFSRTINTLLEEIKKRGLFYPSTSTTSTPSSAGLPSGSRGGSGVKWVIGIIIALIAITFWGPGSEKKKESTY